MPFLFFFSITLLKKKSKPYNSLKKNILVFQKDNFVNSDNVFQILLTKQDNRLGHHSVRVQPLLYYWLLHRKAFIPYTVRNPNIIVMPWVFGKWTNGTLPDFFSRGILLYAPRIYSEHNILMEYQKWVNVLRFYYNKTLNLNETIWTEGKSLLLTGNYCYSVSFIHTYKIIKHFFVKGNFLCSRE